MGAIAHGRIIVWEGASLWVFDVPAVRSVRKTDVHAHHALQVTMALDGAFRLEAGEQSAEQPIAVVAADQSHAFEAEGLIALLFVEPESAQGRAIARGVAKGALTPLSFDGVSDLVARIAEGFRASAPDAELRAAGRELAARLAGGVEPAPSDPRIAEAVAWASNQLDRRIGIADAAPRFGLSPGRLSHLFVEQTGLPFRTYVLWLRLTRAVETYAGGANLTTAAHEAGFSDSAHFSRTFRRMFGVSAAALDLT